MKTAKTTKMIISNSKPFIGNYLPGDRYPGLEPDIWFYKVEDYDKSDSGYEAVIDIKIDKVSTATKQNTKNLTFPVIKIFWSPET